MEIKRSMKLALDPYSKRTAWLMMLLGVGMVISVAASLVFVITLILTLSFTFFAIPFFIFVIVYNVAVWSLSKKLEKKYNEKTIIK